MYAIYFPKECVDPSYEIAIKKLEPLLMSDADEGLPETVKTKKECYQKPISCYVLNDRDATNSTIEKLE
ncbi:hypothetical protein KY289_013348 [Solanum tuberosum]|nr:hypothetical protein KY289_013348 [Solanum tuberosum]